MDKMTNFREQKLQEKISFFLGIVSLIFTIYFSAQPLFQVVFGITTLIFIVAYFILQNKSQIADIQESLTEMNSKIKKMEESLNIYERLTKLEKEVFKHDKR